LFLSLLKSGHPAEWAADLRSQESNLLVDFEGLCEAFLTINPDGVARMENAKAALSQLKQKKGESFLTFWQQYQRLAREAKAPVDVQLFNLPNSLDPQLRASYLKEAVKPTSLAGLVELLIRLDQGIVAAAGVRDHAPNPAPVTGPVPMDLGQLMVAINNLTVAMSQQHPGRRRGRLTREERERRIANDLCLICADPNHKMETCPRRRNQGNDRG
jgi:hypothetical protein